MVSLQVRFQHRHDPAALGFSGRDVVVDQIRVRVDHGQLTRGVAAELGPLADTQAKPEVGPLAAPPKP